MQSLLASFRRDWQSWSSQEKVSVVSISLSTLIFVASSINW